MTQFDFKKLVDAEYLLNDRTNNNVVVIDARGGMLEEGSLMYDKAIVVDWTDISLLGEFGGEDLGKLLSKENYQQIFSKLGITDKSEVLVYGFTMPEQGFGDEARVLYTFSYAGFDNVKFIDGGFKQVEKLGFNKNYELSSDRIDVSDVVRSEATQNDKAIYTDELLSKIGNTDVQIIDTRLEVEYNGRVIYGENKAGHIPGAISLPFNSLVDNNGFLKSREVLEKYVIDKGLDKNKLQVTYCTTGVRASYVAVILEELGFKVRNYEPSFARYANVGEVVLD
ncbi:sulfurtransferase [Gemella sp.]